MKIFLMSHSTILTIRRYERERFLAEAVLDMISMRVGNVGFSKHSLILVISDVRQWLDMRRNDPKE